ncbi:MAG: hypothetical protein LBG60_06345, partial [Bifidobacteriaceae bacterium]|nr:hypothetical protein [Bifidobacteriaceae bacterium]
MASLFALGREQGQTGSMQMRSVEADGVPSWLRVGAGNAWRWLVLAAAAYVAVRVVAEVELVAIALFGAFVITSVLRPLVNLLARPRWMPRALATGIGFIVALAV